MTEQIAEKKNEIIVSLNPSEILGLYSDFLARQGGKIICVRGIYKHGPDKAYSGYYYDMLCDEFSSQEISIKVPTALRENLTDGNLVHLYGIIERRLNTKGFIQLLISVSRAEIVKEQIISEEDVQKAIIRRTKDELGYKNVDAILENLLLSDKRPNIALVYAETSITSADFSSGLGASSIKIDFSEFRINFANPQSVVEFCSSLNQEEYDAIAFIRGGGSGIEQLDNLEILEAVCNLKVPVISAVGHVNEKIFFKNIVDKVILTPNALGVYFRNLVEEVSEKQSKSKAVLVKQVEAQFKEQLELAKKQNGELRKQMEEMVKANEAGRKVYEEQMGKLNVQLTELQKINKSQGEIFANQAKQIENSNIELKKTVDSLTEKNNQYIEKLSKNELENKSLENSLKRQKISTTIGFILAAGSILCLLLM